MGTVLGGPTVPDSSRATLRVPFYKALTCCPKMWGPKIWTSEMFWEQWRVSGATGRKEGFLSRAWVVELGATLDLWVTRSVKSNPVLMTLQQRVIPASLEKSHCHQENGGSGCTVPLRTVTKQTDIMGVYKNRLLCISRTQCPVCPFLPCGNKHSAEFGISFLCMSLYFVHMC